MTVRCLIAGFNYPGTGMDLPDCILDAERKRDRVSLVLPDTPVIYQTDRSPSEYFADIKEFVESIGVDDVGIWFDSRHTSRRRGVEADGWEELIVCMPKPGEDGYLIPDHAVSKLLAKAYGPVFYVTDSCHGVGFDNGLLRRRTAFYGGPIARFVELPGEEPEPGEVVEYTSKLEDGGWRGLLHAGCKENQYSYSTGKGGAFSIWWDKLWQPGMTWRQLQKAIVPACLPTIEYPQRPALLGRHALRNKVVLV